MTEAGPAVALGAILLSRPSEYRLCRGEACLALVAQLSDVRITRCLQRATHGSPLQYPIQINLQPRSLKLLGQLQLPTFGRVDRRILNPISIMKNPRAGQLQHAN